MISTNIILTDNINLPLTLILSCKEPTLPVPQEPLRSSFCFPESLFSYQSKYDLLQLKNQWDTFEKVENFNSIVLNNLANAIPQENVSAVTDSIFYQFQSSEEKTNYNLGQLYHTIAYPLETDFLQPYANRPIPYTSTIISTINGTKYTDQNEPVCVNILPPKPQPADVILNNRLGQNIYVRVSSYNAQFPKSPYKFSSNNEYITYMNYKSVNC